MKKLIKTIAFAGATVAAASLVNHIIFKTANVAVKSKFIRFNYKWRHGDINYVAAGFGEPILMLHGIGAGCSLLEWEEQISLLSNSHRVYAFDFLGFGDSAKPELSYSAYLYASLIKDFTRDVIKEPPYVIASSSSSAFAISACALNPDLFKKMLLVSPTGIGTSNKPVTKASLFVKRLVELPVIGTSFYNILCSKKSTRMFLDRHCSSGELPVSKDTLLKYYYSAHRRGACARFPIAAFLSNFLNVDLRIVLPKTDVPIHVVWGGENELNPVKNLSKLVNINPEIEFTIFEGSKLLPHKDQPKKFYKLCKEMFS